MQKVKKKTFFLEEKKSFKSTDANVVCCGQSLPAGVRKLRLQGKTSFRERKLRAFSSASQPDDADECHDYCFRMKTGALGVSFLICDDVKVRSNTFTDFFPVF